MFEQCFADRICQEVKKKKSHVVIGLDPVISRIPGFIKEEAEKAYGINSEGAAFAIIKFNKLIIEAIKDHVAVIKPQLAYYEVYGSYGIHAFWETVRYAQEKGLIVIADAKRGDIDSTAKAYAHAFFGGISSSWSSCKNPVDALTINPYLGRDSLTPFIEESFKRNAGLFILVKTSNMNSGDFQDHKSIEGISVAEKVGTLVYELGKKHVGVHGYSSVGAVIGATQRDNIERFRHLMPQSIFLVPGYGAQGARGKDIVNAFNGDGLGALISASRSIIYSYEELDNHEGPQVQEAITRATMNMNEDINTELKIVNKLHWAE